MGDQKKRKPVALIVDDEKSICSTLSGVFSDEGWECITAQSGGAGVHLYQNNDIDLVMLDVWMKGLDGIETLQMMKGIKKSVPIVVMSGHGTIETAVKATKLGAYDFLEKPLSLEKLLPMINNASAKKQSRLSNESFRSGHYELIGVSEAVASLHRQIQVIAPRNSWILITGENGTGKEVVARNIHLHSHRADKNFVAVNCAAIPEELIESELFGHAKGAFTNALNDKLGKFEQAHKGTLFLDEIGDMSLKTQAKILRILQEQTFERLGAVDTISVDVRVIAATNKNLQSEIKKGYFREDLFYRLNVIPVHMCPLRERAVDIPVLVDHFLKLMANELNEPEKTCNQEALEMLQAYLWPGNIRELRNLIERLSILVEAAVITAVDLPDYIIESAEIGGGEDQDKEGDGVAKGGEAEIANLNPTSYSLKEAKSKFEKTFIMDKLDKFDWNVSKTAEAIGIERSNLHRKLRAFGIDTKQIKV